MNEPFAKFGVGHEMGAECSCKITPSKGICTWLAMGFPLGARASRPHPVPLAAVEHQCDAAGSHPVGGNSIGQAEGEPWRRSRLIQVGEMAEAVPGLVRAGRPRSQQAIIVRAGRPRSREAIIP